MNSRIGIFAIVVVVLLVNACVDATPAGYYREQHEYEKNEARYVNGQLQHSSKDAEFLAKQGELAAVTVSPPTKHHFKHHEEYNKKKEEREESDEIKNDSHFNEHENRSNLMKQMRESDHHEQLVKQIPPIFLVNGASAAAAKKALDANLKAELSMSSASMSYGHQLKTDDHVQNANSYGNKHYGLSKVQNFDWPHANADYQNKNRNAPTEYVSNKELSNSRPSYESASASASGREEAHLGRVTLHKDSNIRQPFDWAPNTAVDEAAASQLTRQCYQAWKVYSNEEMNRKLRESNKDAARQFDSQRMQMNDERVAAGQAQQYGYSQRQHYSANADYRY